ncbi:PilZ domain-containing protein [Nitrospiraceae bacterium AH_259_D15_M11_P09]|nr:PilZ domain-containing protein [Nitrospiraceae bacterium AH_259_D15_M11_P09]
MQLREYLRAAFECPAELFGDELFGEGTVLNLSIGGFAVESDQPVKAGMTLKLRVFLPDDEKPIVIRATIRWAREGKFGVKTTLIGIEDKKRLREFIVSTVDKSSYNVRRSAPQHRS